MIAASSILVASAALLCGVWGGPAGSANADDQARITLLAPQRSRVADEIRRELEASSFTLIAPDIGGRPWREYAMSLRSQTAWRGVAVDAEERHVFVFTVTTNPEDAIEVHADLSVDADDRIAQRRLTLAVVEYLRLFDDSQPRDLPPPIAATPPLVAASARPDRPPASAPSVTPGQKTVLRPWALGAATTVNFDSFVGEPTSHVVFVGLWRPWSHVHLVGRVSWPVVGSQFRTENAQVRMWTFGATTGLSLQPLAPPARLHPYIGLGFGARVVLADAALFDGFQSRVAAIPAAVVNAWLGVRYAIAAKIRAFVELEAAASRQIGSAGWEHERTAAGARSAHAALGVLFEL